MIQKTAEATGGLIGSKIDDKSKRGSKHPETNEEEMPREK